MQVIFWWFVLSGVAGAIASNKGRSGPGFFFLSLALSPLLGIIIALVVKLDRSAVEQMAVASGDSRKCPFCAELIK
jgi:hypothetical protein